MKHNTPHLEQNDRGMWEIRWTEDRRSMRKSTRTSDRTEAERALAQFLLDRHDERHGSHAMKVGDALDRYITEHVASKVVDKQRQLDIIANLRPFFGGMLVRDIRPNDVLLYGSKRADGVVGSKPARSNGTLRRELNCLIAALNHAVRAKRIAATDVPYIPLPAAPAAKDLWLTESEVEELLAAADAENAGYPLMDRGYLFVHIALATASRRRAIEKLRWDQVDLDARLIHFRPAGDRQTKKRRVPVPINDELLAVLQRARELATSEYVLHSSKSCVRRFQAVCQRAADATGNRKFLSVTPHTLRHTWATLAARAGVALYEIAGILGDDLATVQRNYLHHCPDHLRGAVNFRARNGARGSDLSAIPARQ